DEGLNIEGQKESLKNFPSKIEAQNLILKKGEDKTELDTAGKEPQLNRLFDPETNISAKEEEKSGETVHFPAVSLIPNVATSTSGEEKEKIEEQNQTLKNRPSKFASQNSLREEEIQGVQETSSAVTPESGADLREEPEKGLLEDQVSSRGGADEREGIGVLTEVPSETEQLVSTDGLEETLKDASLEETHPKDLELKDNLDKSLFFSFYNEVNDELLPTLDAAEQILYSRLFRLSYGFNRNYCTVSQPILGEKTGLSRNTVRTGLQSLSQKKWISVIEAGNHISTTYRVYLPREKTSGSNFDPQKRTLKNRTSNNERQNLSGKFRSSKIDNQGGQKTAVQNSSGKKILGKFPNWENHLQPPPPDFDPQKMSPLLITNNSFTLSGRESEDQLSYEQSLLPSAQKLVDKFYSLLAQQPSTAKREKSAAECLALLRDGFSSDQIDYAITWLIAHHPTTGSFSRVAYFIDQALKAREQEQFAGETEGRKNAELERKKLEERRLEEQGKQI